MHCETSYHHKWRASRPRVQQLTNVVYHKINKHGLQTKHGTSCTIVARHQQSSDSIPAELLGPIPSVASSSCCVSAYRAGADSLSGRDANPFYYVVKPCQALGMTTSLTLQVLLMCEGIIDCKLCGLRFPDYHSRS